MAVLTIRALLFLAHVTWPLVFGNSHIQREVAQQFRITLELCRVSRLQPLYSSIATRSWLLVVCRWLSRKGDL